MGFDFLVEERFPAEAVDGLVAGGLDDPGAGMLGDAGFAPLLDGGGEGLLGAVFGELEVAEEADESGDDAAPV